MKKTEIAWAAGFFDGEGSTKVRPLKRRLKKTYRLELIVRQVHPAVLERFRDAVGLGSIYGPWKNGYQRADGSTGYIYEYWVGSKNAESVLKKLWPYLSAQKKEQAERKRAELKERTG